MSKTSKTDSLREADKDILVTVVHWLQQGEKKELVTWEDKKNGSFKIHDKETLATQLGLRWDTLQRKMKRLGITCVPERGCAVNDRVYFLPSDNIVTPSTSTQDTSPSETTATTNTQTPSATQPNLPPTAYPVQNIPSYVPYTYPGAIPSSTNIQTILLVMPPTSVHQAQMSSAMTLASAILLPPLYPPTVPIAAYQPYLSGLPHPHIGPGLQPGMPSPYHALPPSSPSTYRPDSEFLYLRLPKQQQTAQIESQEQTDDEDEADPKEDESTTKEPDKKPNDGT